MATFLFHQSGGCCDGSAPMCYPQGEFLVGDGDVLLGEIGGAPFYIGAAQFDYWKHTQLVIDVVPGQGGMFSLDNGTGLRFLTRSRLFSDDELAHLPPARPPICQLESCARGARPLREFWRPRGRHDRGARAGLSLAPGLPGSLRLTLRRRGRICRCIGRFIAAAVSLRDDGGMSRAAKGADCKSAG